jgi:hypothetical protein
MTELTDRLAERGSTGEAACVAARDQLQGGSALSIGTPDIPVRRYGKVPPLPEEEQVWEIESVAAAAPRTIAEYGGVAVLLAALGAAALAGCVLYLH